MQLLEVLQHSPDSENYKLQDKQIKFETQGLIHNEEL